MKKSVYSLMLTIGLLVMGCGSVETTGTDTTDNSEVISESVDTSSENSNTNSSPTESGNQEMAATGSLTVSGKITFDRIHPKANGVGLDHTNITQEPARQVVVKAIDASNSVVTATTTDDNGNYRLENLPEDTPIKVRVYAMMYKTSTSSQWDVSVVDNTNGKSTYVVEGSLVSSGTQDSTRNLNASSGWNSSFNDYMSTRVAAPFAILDSIYTGMERILSADANANFPKLIVNWSVDNTSAGDGSEAAIRDGMIITSHYNGQDGQFYILGDKNTDTDEYDDHIIVHEWGHYFEDKFSRADNIGGSHSQGERLDIRVAFGEGWGNAISAIATDDPIYFDTMGLKQSSGWYMNIETQLKNVPGWYSEASIQRILYDLYDSNNDGSDKLSLGFKPIYNVLTGAQKNSSAFTSLFTFITALKQENTTQSSQIDAIVASEEIKTISDIFGNTHYTLYDDMTVGTSHNVCTTTKYGVQNKLDTHKYIRFSVSSSDTYAISVTQNNSMMADPDFALFKRTPFTTIGISQGENYGYEEHSYSLSKGDYLLDISDYNNQTQACFTVTIN